MMVKNGHPREQHTRTIRNRDSEANKLLSPRSKRIRARKSRESTIRSSRKATKIPVPFRVGSLMTYAFGDIAKKSVSVLMNMIKAKVLYTVAIDELRHQIEPWLLCRYFKNIPAEESYITYTEVDELGDVKNRHMTTHPGMYADFITFRGVKIGFIIEVDESRERQYDPSISLCCLNTKHSIEALNEFIKSLIKETIKEREKRCREFAQTNSLKYSNSWVAVKIDKRSFDNVFIPSKDQELLSTSISSFIEKRDWYEEHKIPYHFGILLHGVGGTGKSSIIKAICSEFDVEPFLIKALELDEIRSMLTYRDFRNKPAVVIVEDVDTYEFTNNRHIDGGGCARYEIDSEELEGALVSRKGKLGQLLNFMDGFNSPSNVIYIFTTNHIEDLDKALIRPGRIDLCIEISYVTDETFDKFLMFHYEKHLPSDKHVDDKLTFASLQTEVMRGATYDELLEMYTK